MSKHQSCFICHRDFVGPDNCIGNMCPECDADVHRDCHQSIGHLETEVANKEVEIKEQRADAEYWRAQFNIATGPMLDWSKPAKSLNDLHENMGRYAREYVEAQAAEIERLTKTLISTTLQLMCTDECQQEGSYSEQAAEAIKVLGKCPKCCEDVIACICNMVPLSQVLKEIKDEAFQSAARETTSDA